MSNVAKLFIEQPGASNGELYLGPAHIVETGLRDVTIRLESGCHVSAQLALALPYIPAEDDVVLALGKGRRHYVVGVLHSSGQTSLSFRGDVRLKAVGGALELTADKGVRVRGSEVDIEARELRLTAESVVQKCWSMVQRVRHLLSVRAERIDTTVDEGTVTKAKRATILTEETVTINGKQIHLG